MQLQSPFHVVAPTVDGDVLTVLARADAEFTIAELQRMIGSRSNEGIRRSLERLVRNGVVRRHTVGRANAYTLNRHHIAAPVIAALADLAATLRARITDRISGWAEPPVYAAMFGSAASDSMRPDSDIDIFLVRDGVSSEAWDEQVAALVHDITDWTGNDARPLVFEESEIRGRADDERVLRDIIENGITLVGDRSAFSAWCAPRDTTRPRRDRCRR